MTQKGFRERLGIDIVARPRSSKDGGGPGGQQGKLGFHVVILLFLLTAICLGLFYPGWDQSYRSSLPVILFVLVSVAACHLVYLLWSYCACSMSPAMRRRICCCCCKSPSAEDADKRPTVRSKIAINLNPIGFSKNVDEYIDIDV